MMKPEIIRTVKSVSGDKRHILRGGKSPDDPPSFWPICVCTYLDMEKDSVKEYDSMDEVENLCENCENRVIDDGS